MNKLIKNYIYNILYQLFMIIVPIFTAPYLARTLGATQMGIYGYINSISSIVITIGLIGLNNYGIREIAYVRDDRDKLQKIFSELIILRILLCSLMTIFYFLIFMNSIYKYYFSIQYLLILATFIDISWFFIAIEEMKCVVFRNFIAKIITVICIFLFVKDENDLVVYLFSFAFITFITTIGLYKKLTDFNIKLFKNYKNIFTHLSPAIKIFLPQIAGLLYLQIDKIMINFITNQPNQIAFYEQGEKIILIPLALITALSGVIMPRLANEYSKKNITTVKNFLNKSIEFSLFISIPMSMGIAGIASNLIPWYLGDEFYGVINVMIIIAPIIVANSLTNVSGNQYFTATNQTGIMTFAYIITLVINIFINLILIPLFGYIGAAVATLISSSISVLIQYYFLNRQINIKETLKSGVKYFFSASMMGFLVFIIGFYNNNTPIITIFQIFIGVLIYFSILMIFKDKMVYLLIEKIFLVIKNKL